MPRLDFFPKEDLIAHYRTVFSSPHGRAVLTHMLYDLGVFQEITDGPEDVALKNYGTRLLMILAGGAVNESSIEGFAKLLMMQPVNKIKE